MKRRRVRVSAVGTAATLCLLGVTAVGTAVGSERQSFAKATAARGGQTKKAKALQGRLPLSFEINKGQAGRDVRFLSRGKGYTLFLTPREAVLALRKGTANLSKLTQSGATKDPEQVSPAENAVVRMEFLGASSRPEVKGLERLAGKSNYFIGRDPSKWRTGVEHFAKVQYEDVYRGVDLLYYGTQGKLEYDFVVQPGADPSKIRMAVRGADELAIRDNDLVMQVDGVELRQERPVVYQEKAGVRQVIPASYRLAQGGVVGFKLGAYDHNLPLVIDPVFTYSTYLGGSGPDQAEGVAIDEAGNLYIAGGTISAGAPSTYTNKYPLQSAYDSTYNGGNSDVFVTKMSPDGRSLLFSTFIGGNGIDVANDIALDAQGNIYFVGYTTSTNYPLQSAVQTTRQSLNDGIITKLANDGSSLVWSTYHGGNNDDYAWAVAIDSSGNPYVGGQTRSNNFPVTPGAFKTLFGADIEGFVTKFNGSTGARTGTGCYSTYITGGGSQSTINRSDKVFDIAVDGSGQAYVTGTTNSTNFPTFNANQASLAGSFDAFMTTLNSGGTGLVRSTYIGGNVVDEGHGIVLDNAGNVYVCGASNSSLNFTMVNAYQPVNAGGSDAFLIKYSSGGTMLYSSYFGGSNGEDVANAIDVDANQRVYMTGSTTSSDSSSTPTLNEGFPTTPNAIQPLTASGGIKDSFLVWVETTQSGAASFSYGTYLGGTGQDVGNDIKTDLHGCGAAVVVGTTTSNNFPVQYPFQAMKGSTSSVDSDAFIYQIDENSIPRAAAGSDVVTQCNGTGGITQVTLDASASSGEEDDPTPATYQWYEGATLLGTGKVISAGFTLGTHTVTLRMTDWCSRVGTDTLTVSVSDTTAPVFSSDSENTGTLPQLTFYSEADMCDSDTDPTTPSAADACDTNVSVTGVRSDSEPLTSPYPEGETTITWTASDSASNTRTATQLVVVVDNIAPTLTYCPPDQVLTAGVGQSTASVDPGFPVFTDNCEVMMVAGFRDNADNPDVPIEDDSYVGTFPLGTTTITWLAFDPSFNVTTCETRITVLDPSHAASIWEFPAGVEDWTVDGVPAAHVIAGGNPDGYITGLGDYFEAPVSGLNAANQYGHQLEFSLRQNVDSDQLTTTADVVLVGNGITLTYDLANPGVNWTFYRLYLHETGGWKNQSTGLPATQSEVQQVLQNLTALKIRSKWNCYLGGSSADLDSVRLGVPYVSPLP